MLRHFPYQDLDSHNFAFVALVDYGAVSAFAPLHGVRGSEVEGYRCEREKLHFMGIGRGEQDDLCFDIFAVEELDFGDGGDWGNCCAEFEEGGHGWTEDWSVFEGETAEDLQWTGIVEVVGE
jgi:hypothetical protein